MSRSFRSRAASSSATSSCSVTGRRMSGGDGAAGGCGRGAGRGRSAWGWAVLGGTVRHRTGSGGRTMRSRHGPLLARNRGAVARPVGTQRRISDGCAIRQRIRARDLRSVRSRSATRSERGRDRADGDRGRDGPSPAVTAVAAEAVSAWSRSSGRSGAEDDLDREQERPGVDGELVEVDEAAERRTTIPSASSAGGEERDADRAQPAGAVPPGAHRRRP